MIYNTTLFLVTDNKEHEKFISYLRKINSRFYLIRKRRAHYIKAKGIPNKIIINLATKVAVPTLIRILRLSIKDYVKVSKVGKTVFQTEEF